MVKGERQKRDCGRGGHDIWKCKQDLRGDRGRLRNGRVKLHGGHGVRLSVGGCGRGLWVRAGTSVTGYRIGVVVVGLSDSSCGRSWDEDCIGTC